MSGQTYGLYIYRGIFLINLTILFRGHLKLLKLHSKSNIPLYIRICYSSKSHYQNVTKQKLEFATNGMQCKGGVLIIGTYFFNRKFAGKQLVAILPLQ